MNGALSRLREPGRYAISNLHPWRAIRAAWGALRNIARDGLGTSFRLAARSFSALALGGEILNAVDINDRIGRRATIQPRRGSMMDEMRGFLGDLRPDWLLRNALEAPLERHRLASVLEALESLGGA